MYTQRMTRAHICVIYGVAFSEKDTGAGENEKERNLAVYDPGKKITGGAEND